MFLLFETALAATLMLPEAVLSPGTVTYTSQTACKPPSAFQQFTPVDSRLVFYESALGRHEALVSCTQNQPIQISIYPHGDPEHRYVVSLVEYGILLDRRDGTSWRRICDVPSCSTDIDPSFRRLWAAAYQDMQTLRDATSPFIEAHSVPEQFASVDRVFPPLPADAADLFFKTHDGITRVSPVTAQSSTLTVPVSSERMTSLSGKLSSAPLLSPNGQQIAITANGVLRLVDTESGTIAAQVPLSDGVMTHSWSPSGRQLLISVSRRYMVFHPEQGMRTLQLSERPVGWMDDGTLLTLSSGNQLYSMSLEDGETTLLLELTESIRDVWWRSGQLVTRCDQQVLRGDTLWFSAPEGAQRQWRLSPNGNTMALQVGSDIYIYSDGMDAPARLTELPSLHTFAWYGNEHLVLSKSYPAPVTMVRLDGAVFYLPITGAPVARGQH